VVPSRKEYDVPEPGGTLKVCLNGARSRTEHPAVPVTPEQLADEAAAAEAAGAEVVHLHPRTADGRESLSWSAVQLAVAAIRDRCPELTLGVSTREEIEPGLAIRRRFLAEWHGPPAGPDLASVNWHEEDAAAVAHLLAGRGIGIEAGLFTPTAALKLLSGEQPGGLVRILVEAIPGITPGEDGPSAVQAMLAELPELPDELDLVVHGEEEWAWPVLWWARERGFGIRIGFEDVLAGPSGEPVQGNADLVRLARSAG